MHKIIEDTPTELHWKGLANFNKYHSNFIKQEILRTIIFDYCIPLILGSIATSWYLWKVWYIFPSWIAVISAIGVTFLFEIIDIYKKG